MHKIEEKLHKVGRWLGGLLGRRLSLVCATHVSRFGVRQTKVKSIKKKVASDACIGACTCYSRPARRHAPTASLCRTDWATDVTFNEQESWKRCILDYGRYKGWCVCVGAKARVAARLRVHPRP